MTMTETTDENDVDPTIDPEPEGDQYQLLRPTNLNELEAQIGRQFRLGLDQISLTTTSDPTSAAKKAPVQLWVIASKTLDRDQVQQVINDHVMSNEGDPS